MTTLLRCDLDGAPRWGMIAAAGVRLVEADIATTADLLSHDLRQPRELARDHVQPIAGLKLLSPVTRPAQIICQGLDYRDHAVESGHQQRQENLFFQKASSSLSGPFDDVVRPRGCELLDYEVELGLVLRNDITEHSVIDHTTLGDFVGGFVICNEISARDLMFGAPFMQWFYGKSGRTFCPCGPYLVVPEPAEVAAALAALELQLWLNGELRQSARAADLIFAPAATLAQIASFMDMAAGDLLLTGTPGGFWLKPRRQWRRSSRISCSPTGHGAPAWLPN